MALEKLDQILADFKSLPDRDLKSELLLEYAERFVPVPERIAIRPFAEGNRVPACESEAYIWCEALSDGLKFHFAVENPQGISAKALAAILDETLSGASASEVLQIKEEIIYELFGRGLSMGKGQGLMGMVRMIKALAANNLRVTFA